MHTGGRNNICRDCSLPHPQACMFFTKAGKLTRYSFACGYVEFNKDKSKNLSMEHGVYHVKGFDSNGRHVWVSFLYVKEARKFLHSPS